MFFTAFSPAAFGGLTGATGFTTPAAVGQGTYFDREQILQHVFDATRDGIKIVDAGAASGTYGTKFDEEQIWQHVYDPDSTAIRVVFV